MTLPGTLLEWAKSNSGVISVTGALIIFFSWAISNTFGQRYNRIKAATESAQSTFRLYRTLHEQRDQLNSLAMEVIQRSEKGPDASRFSPGKTSNTLLDQARKQFSRDRLSAHQVRELMDFTVETNELSRSVGTVSPTSEDIQQILGEVDAVYQALLKFQDSAEQAINAPERSPEEVVLAVQEYSNYYRSEALPKVPEFYRRIVNASNVRRREADAQLAAAKARAERSESLTIWVYVVGSILAITGQAIEKAKPKESPAKQVAIMQTGNVPAVHTSADQSQATPKQSDSR
jgi:hypothetical protein